VNLDHPVHAHAGAPIFAGLVPELGQGIDTNTPIGAKIWRAPGAAQGS
jgi:hypothetical protein